MTFQVLFSNGGALRLIEVAGVLFLGLKGRAQQRDTKLLLTAHTGRVQSSAA
jgi:hypothetical protein